MDGGLIGLGLFLVVGGAILYFGTTGKLKKGLDEANEKVEDALDKAQAKMDELETEVKLVVEPQIEKLKQKVDEKLK